MTDATALVDRYLAVWNATEPEARRALLDEVFAPDARYTDPLMSVQGRDQLDAAIAAAQGQFAGLVFSSGGAVDAHHDIARFTWNLGPEGQEPAAIGFDVIEIDKDGRITSVLGFLDKVPAGM
ncbi:polyketide cyclase [Mangrovactinospora gilvigrisea]|uniref:Polyketide cyclase n=1 Tax=Mangrovactinospora gilvigrisea TaxID=1428644 RepID=A0A1J7CI19_9ACTN|nr:nuclear transport factor 2 family protein [Mangrovactinospora gilvigrisea]OIV39274.1 polyketide cyclase [Mangrovactinospora gilvigrisea]